MVSIVSYLIENNLDYMKQQEALEKAIKKEKHNISKLPIKVYRNVHNELQPHDVVGNVGKVVIGTY